MSGNKLKEIFENNTVEKTVSGEMKITPDKLSFLYQIGWYCAGPKQQKKRRVEKNGYEVME